MAEHTALDHALLLRAFVLGVARWEPFAGQPDKGEVCFGGLRHATGLDGFGCPVLTGLMRSELPAAISKAEATLRAAGVGR